jgi:hypothetical protein
MGPNDRIEYLSARVHPQHLRTGKKPSPRMVKRIKKMGSKGDDTGHVIAKNLGGPGDHPFNFLPQNSEINWGIWRRLEEEVANALRSKKANRVDMKFNLIYHSRKATRPESFLGDFEYHTTGGSSLFKKLILNNK